MARGVGRRRPVGNDGAAGALIDQYRNGVRGGRHDHVQPPVAVKVHDRERGRVASTRIVGRRRVERASCIAR